MNSQYALGFFLDTCIGWPRLTTFIMIILDTLTCSRVFMWNFDLFTCVLFINVFCFSFQQLFGYYSHFLQINTLFKLLFAKLTPGKLLQKCLISRLICTLPLNFDIHVYIACIFTLHVLLTSPVVYCSVYQCLTSLCQNS